MFSSFRVVAALVGFAFGLFVSAASAQSVTFGTSLPSDPVLDWHFPRCAESTTELAKAIGDCMVQVMHPRGSNGGQGAEVDVSSAALVCRRSRSAEDARSLHGCVRSLMYDRGGLGDRRGFLSGADAAVACRYVTSVPHAEIIEDCMKRMLFTRGGLGYQRTEVNPTSAAYTCQGVVAPPPRLTWPYTPVCRPPSGEEASRFLEDCAKRLMFKRDGLGERREEVTSSAALLACQGAISWSP